MKEVKITGLSVNKQLGILQACQLEFDNKNRLIPIKGRVGQGKTILKKAIQLPTQGSKTMIDKNLYQSEIDLETQLLDGDNKIYVGCRTNKSNDLVYTLYIKDSEGKKVNDPVIDGVKATPSKYLETLQTELTWKMDELTSENQSVQKKILLKLYQFALQKVGVIFDNQHPDYPESILGRIDLAETKRNNLDAIRKQKGGIADDLKANGFDPDRPQTIPDAVDVLKIDEKIKELEKEKTVAETKGESEKQIKLQAIAQKASDLNLKCIAYNDRVQQDYDREKTASDQYQRYLSEINVAKTEIENQLTKLKVAGFIDDDDLPRAIDDLSLYIQKPEEVAEPKKLIKVAMDSEGKVKAIVNENLPEKQLQYLKDILKLRQDYKDLLQKEDKAVDTSEIDTKIAALEKEKANADEINKIVSAVDSFHNWRDSNEKVIQLKKEYTDLLKKVNTGVDGLTIEDVDDQIFLMYNGAYDPDYFGNENKESRKLSSYSGTQRPVICLLIQHYLLSKKPKALRYMYIDNVPIDNKTRELFEKMCDELELRVFLNMTGDFEKVDLPDGEIFIEGGEVFFN